MNILQQYFNNSIKNWHIIANRKHENHNKVETLQQQRDCLLISSFIFQNDNEFNHTLFIEKKKYFRLLYTSLNEKTSNLYSIAPSSLSSITVYVSLSSFSNTWLNKNKKKYVTYQLKILCGCGSRCRYSFDSSHRRKTK